MIVFIDLSTREVLQHPMECASIPPLQKLYWVHFANSKGGDYLPLGQFDLVGRCFYFRKSLWLVFFDLRIACQADIDISIGRIQVVRFLLDMFNSFSSSSLTVSSLIASFDFISTISNFVLFIFCSLFTILQKLLTQIFDTFSGS